MAQYMSRVDDGLSRLVSKNLKGTERTLTSSGKRWRPKIIITIAYYSGKRIDEDVINSAIAVELIHLASLVHDDIIDGAKLRHGEPTINAKEGTDYAILAGDDMIAKGCLTASHVNNQAGILLAETVSYLCDGQAIELNSRYDVSRTKESLLQSIKGKTASLFVATCKLGGLVAELNEKETKALSEFAENFGIAYQLVDDVNDFAEIGKVPSKSVGNDIAEGNYTLPIILSLKGPNGPMLKKLLKSRTAVTPEIRQILTKDKSLVRTIDKAEEYKQNALRSLEKLNNRELATILKKFVHQF